MLSLILHKFAFMNIFINIFYLFQGNVMDSNDSVLYNEFRKKRVKLFKRLILFVIGFFIALPNVLSIFLIISLHNTNSSLDKLSNELNILKNTRTELISSEENKTVLPEENEIEEADGGKHDGSGNDVKD